MRVIDYLMKRRGTLKELMVYSLQTYGVTVVSMIGAIITVRVLDRYEYGIYGIIFSIIGIVYVVLNAGIVRQVSNRILASPLEQDEKRLYMAYTKQGFIYTSLVGIALIPVFLIFYDFKTTLYIFIALFAQHLMGFIGLLIFSEIRERKLKEYYLLETLIEYSRVVLPVLGVIIFRNLAGYFAGSALIVLASVILIFSFAYWRKKAMHYLSEIRLSSVSFKEFGHLIRLGLSMSLESGAATLYASALILMGATYLGVTQAADLKVLMGYFTALGMTLLPLNRWVTFHLPKKISNSSNPFRELLRIAGLATVFILAVYLVGVLVGPWLLPLVYGQKYAGAAAYIPWIGGMLVFSSMAIGLSTISRQYKLSFLNGIVSLTNIVLGLIFVVSPFGPRSIAGFSIFYSLWLLPALIATYALVYFRIQRKVDNA
ncbi:MAG: hypothetical protein PHC70_03515 [Patescibacteria group bacterium]|nr:hypothetical protein [Patescibacteria group bacterium]